MHMIVPIVPVVSNNVQTTETTIWGHCQDDLKRPRHLRRPRSLEWNWVLSRRSGRSSKFWSDHMKTLSAVLWEDDLNDLRLGRFHRNQQSYSSYREKNRPGRRWNRKKNLKQKCSHRVWALFEKKVRSIKFSTWRHYGRFPFVRTQNRPDPFRSNENVTFDQNYPTRLVKS